MRFIDLGLALQKSAIETRVFLKLGQEAYIRDKSKLLSLFKSLYICGRTLAKDFCKLILCTEMNYQYGTHKL